ncbi:hypothetical protein JOF56_010875 [Kibdelosporangium banguiense]|uniref:Uncharacterized protein n=1 Tax=Kibdelosporangium banguiense TaxID=1365924 RepID=A0ABS4U1I3_9PSEU|nr:hypothetical protein [Kibdelosporangium banguiense]
MKLFLAPLLVVGSTLVGWRWGAGVAGILVGLPIVAGPILFISYCLHGGDFVGRAADSSLLGLVALAVFAVVFAFAARRFGWFATVGISWVAVLAVDFGLSFVPVTTIGGLVLSLAATTVAMVLMPGSEPSARPRRSSVWDLPGRAVATGVLVLAVTTASSVLGPHWTGLLAPFPVATSVVAAFGHAQHGADVTARTLAGVLMGLFSFAAFCVTVSTLVRPLGGAAFALGVGVTVFVQLLVVLARREWRASSGVSAPGGRRLFGSRNRRRKAPSGRCRWLR